MFDDYWNLPREKRWLDDIDSPHRIGGRDTYISCIGYTLELTIKARYPINGVPPHIESSILRLQNTLVEAEADIEEVINMVSRDIGNE